MVPSNLSKYIYNKGIKNSYAPSVIYFKQLFYIGIFIMLILNTLPKKSWGSF